MTDWQINPYAVGLLLDAPDDVVTAMSDVYTSAEHVTRMLGLRPRLQSARAIHAVYVQHAANETREMGAWPELADWLDRAALVMVTDLGLDLARVGGVRGHQSR